MSKTKFSVTKNGVPFTDYKWDEKTKTFSSNKHGLVIDFSDIDGVTFKTGYNCTFNTGSYCTFNTGYNCTFNTGSYCTFNTCNNCTFNTGPHCTFHTGNNCVAIRYDVKGIIEIPENKTIKFNGLDIVGYTFVEPEKKKVTLELTDDQLEQVKKMLNT